MSKVVLMCWHSKNAGIELVETAIKKLQKKEVELNEIVYLFQPELSNDLPDSILGISVYKMPIFLKDPSNHIDIYQKLKERIVPLLRDYSETHLNISPGTPAMHAVWLMLHAGGAFPENTKVWSSQWNPQTKRTSLNIVHFPVTTYLAELRQVQRSEPKLAQYDLEAQSAVRRDALEKLARYAQVHGAPLLLLGERGTGKTRLVESVIRKLKNSNNVITVNCGGLDTSVLESTLFGHKKGAFTGAEADRDGLLKKADKGILFLDEVQDLPVNIQRKLVRVLQDYQHRFRPLGSDEEIPSDFQLVCASNQPKKKLKKILDADFYDRISHLEIYIPSLRDCQKDIKTDWSNVWQEINTNQRWTNSAPWNTQLETALTSSDLVGNLRSLQKLAYLILVWRDSESDDIAITRALEEWDIETESEFGTRDMRIKKFRYDLAVEAKKTHGTWEAAAKALKCTEKTLRSDAQLFAEKN